MEGIVRSRTVSNSFAPMEKNGEKIRESRGQRAETTPLFPKNYRKLRRRKTPFDEFSSPKRG